MSGIAILAGGLAIAGAIAFSQRFETTVLPGNPILLLRTDHWTGRILQCEARSADHGPNIPTYLFQRCQTMPGSEQ